MKIYYTAWWSDEVIEEVIEEEETVMRTDPFFTKEMVASLEEARRNGEAWGGTGLSMRK